MLSLALILAEALSTPYAIILAFAGLGGLSGLAAVAMVWVNWRANQRKAVQDDRSVAITELEKAVPGLSDIIKEWQSVVARLQEEMDDLKAENAVLKSSLQDCHQQIDTHLRGSQDASR